MTSSKPCGSTPRCSRACPTQLTSTLDLWRRLLSTVTCLTPVRPCTRRCCTATGHPKSYSTSRPPIYFIAIDLHVITFQSRHSPPLVALASAHLLQVHHCCAPRWYPGLPISCSHRQSHRRSRSAHHLPSSLRCHASAHTQQGRRPMACADAIGCADIVAMLNYPEGCKEVRPFNCFFFQPRCDPPNFYVPHCVSAPAH